MWVTYVVHEVWIQKNQKINTIVQELKIYGKNAEKNVLINLPFLLNSLGSVF